VSIFKIFFISLTRLQGRPLNRFVRKITQTTRFRGEQCLLGFRISTNYFSSLFYLKTPHFGALSIHFQWETPVTTTNRSVNRFSRYMAQNMQLWALYKVAKTIFQKPLSSPIFAPKIPQNGPKWILCKSYRVGTQATWIGIL